MHRVYSSSLVLVPTHDRIVSYRTTSAEVAQGLHIALDHRRYDQQDEQSSFTASFKSWNEELNQLNPTVTEHKKL